ncbi:hypothetical protein ABU162_06015 [Paenibacillus thiaminolyticus]|uniref:hypothetical protein n=1 Tax=Paenibacillus thiaminolyticus TaxID=49283 RepID=UPI0035A663D3
MNEVEISGKLTQLNKELSKTNITDFYIYDYATRPKLVLAGSFDFSYYHDIEITFYEVSFVSCPGVIFTIEQFRLATEEEVRKLNEITYGYNDTPTICLEDVTFNTRFYISAGEVDYAWQKVYYYKRDSLKNNERIADWVK